jgi:hypothetical protein
MDRRQQNDRWWKRLGWLVLIWAASVAALGVVAMLIRLLMRAAGLSSG